MKLSIALAIAVVVGSAATLSQTQLTPPLNQVVFVDVQVAADDGQKIPDLGPAQFEVSLDGSRRRVVTAQSRRVFSSKSAGDGSETVVDSAMQYRLGIEPEPSDHDGNIHQLVVRVDAGGRHFTVQAPTQVRLPKTPSPPPAASSAPLQPSGVPAPSDVAAWERLWGGPEALAAAEKAATAATRAARHARQHGRFQRGTCHSARNTHGLRRSVREVRIGRYRRAPARITLASPTSNASVRIS